MKEYQIRTADLKRVIVRFRTDYIPKAHKMDLDPGEALVIEEWEAPDEADKARLDWLDSRCCVRDGKGVSSQAAIELCTHWSVKHSDIRAAIDAARHAPQPKVTVIKSA